MKKPFYEFLGVSWAPGTAPAAPVRAIFLMPIGLSRLTRASIFSGITGDFDDVVLKADVHDLAAENVHDPQDFGAVTGFGVDADQGHFPFDRLSGR
jgi:hypothetical protein